ncbi:MAG TPA: hypothetical protein DIW81_24725 [Planctomycetaceae bacterium]|nr:hypothetical protein [Planctomycetaceae bacterium]
MALSMMIPKTVQAPLLGISWHLRDWTMGRLSRLICTSFISPGVPSLSLMMSRLIACETKFRFAISHLESCVKLELYACVAKQGNFFI